MTAPWLIVLFLNLKFEQIEARVSAVIFGDRAFLKDWRRRHGECPRRDRRLTQVEYDAYCWRSMRLNRIDRKGERMKKLVPILILLLALTLAACATAPVATIPLDVRTPAMTTTPDAAQPVVAPEPSTLPAAAEISDDPLVKLLADLVKPEDVKVSLAIDDLTGDKIQAQCTTFLALSATQQRVSSLAGVKGIFQIVPIKPVGPLSVIAEARRVDRDVMSGALAARIASKRIELDALRTDFVLACGPLMTDARAAALRFASAVEAAKVGGPIAAAKALALVPMPVKP